jgi:adenine phosphoribosyltransferase
LRGFIRDVVDFPRPGVLFRDITPLLAEPEAFRVAVELLGEMLRRNGTGQILAIESRGFLFGAALALQLRLPLHIVRKAGKLPGETISVDYDLEYGTDRLEAHRGVFLPGARFAIVDDVLATGGTAAAAAELVRREGGTVACAAFLLELGFLAGRERLAPVIVESVIRYE